MTFRGHLKNLDIFGKEDTAAHMKSSNFLEWVEVCFLLQMLEVSKKNEAQLDCCSQTKKTSHAVVFVSHSLSCSDHNIVKLGIVWNTRLVLRKRF